MTNSAACYCCNVKCYAKWAATWQNQQSDCAPSEDSDQPGHPPSLITVFVIRMKKAWVLSYPSGAQQRLWSESSLGAQSLCWFCHVAAHITHRKILQNNKQDSNSFSSLLCLLLEQVMSVHAELNSPNLCNENVLSRTYKSTLNIYLYEFVTKNRVI